jgi:NRPS condensation-like uncharacterized protein
MKIDDSFETLPEKDINCFKICSLMLWNHHFNLSKYKRKKFPKKWDDFWYFIENN